MNDAVLGLYFAAMLFATIAITASAWAGILWYENRELKRICKVNEEAVHLGKALKRLEDGGTVKRCGSGLMWNFTPSKENVNV